MNSYPDLPACGMRFMEFSFHVTDGLKDLQRFWADRGYDRSKEPLLFAGYSRNGHRHTIYVEWLRRHHGCVDIFIGLDARAPAEVWPKRSTKDHRLLAKDFRDFIEYVRNVKRHGGIRARYGYPWVGGIEKLFKAPRMRPLSFTFEVVDEKEKPVLKVAYEKRKSEWLAVVEPSARYPFPEGANVFRQPYELGCSLAKSFLKEP